MARPQLRPPGGELKEPHNDDEHLTRYAARLSGLAGVTGRQSTAITGSLSSQNIMISRLASSQQIPDLTSNVARLRAAATIHTSQLHHGWASRPNEELHANIDC